MQVQHFDIASAQTGGRGQLSDTKVKAVVSQMPLESQPESTKKARWRAVVTRVDEANKTLPENKKIEIGRIADFANEIKILSK